MNREYGLIGQSLRHSFSPQIHAQLGDYSYNLFPMEPEEVSTFLEKVDFAGLNVTIPYKKTVMEFCDALSPAAQRIGSVNTLLRREDGTLYGHNTDYDGLMYTLQTAGISLQGKKVLVLGSGGASLTARTVAHDLGAGQVVIISRTGENHYQNLHLHRDAQVIINTTPVGMYPYTGVAPIRLEEFPQCGGVCDLIYNPANTRLMLDARRLGIPVTGGLGMLVAQAKAASELFQGIRLDDGMVEEIRRDMEAGSKNVLLVGMPGSGKTTIGGVVAKSLGRPFIDTDDLIREEAGCSIPQIFKERGEEGFRALEHRVLEKISRESGYVIATGGGIVTRPENHDLMRQNSHIVFLQRELSELSVDGRPISQSRPVEEIFAQRRPLYESLAELRVENHLIEQAAQDIIAGFGLKG